MVSQTGSDPKNKKENIVLNILRTNAEQQTITLNTT